MKHIILATIGLALAATPALAQDSAQDGSAAVGALSDAAALAGDSGLKLTAAASVLPAAVVMTGAVSVALPALAVGALAAQAAGDSVRAADPEPPRLIVSRQIIVAQPAPQVPYAAQPAQKGDR